MGMGRGGMGGGGSGRNFTIDGETFDPARTDIKTRLGRVEDWTITDASTMDHPFHLHVWPFQVVARTDGDADHTRMERHRERARRRMPSRFAYPLTDISGRTVYHCHILDHEDLGMMGVIHVA